MNFSEIVYLSLRMAILRVKATNTTEKEDEKRDFFLPEVEKSSNNKTFCWNASETYPFVNLHKIEYILLSTSENYENCPKT